MNTAKIYGDATTIISDAEKVEQEQKAAEESITKHQEKVDREMWVGQLLTLQLLSHLKKEISDLQLANENLATVSFEQNKEEILKNTTRISALRKVITYVQTGKNIA